MRLFAQLGPLSCPYLPTGSSAHAHCGLAWSDSQGFRNAATDLHRVAVGMHLQGIRK